MKIFITSNTQFGYRYITKYQISYFMDNVIPMLKEKHEDGDIFIHGGNIFNNRKNVGMDIIHSVMDIFEGISNIMPVFIAKNKSDDISSLILSRVKNVKIINNKKKINNDISVHTYRSNTIADSKNIVIFNGDYMTNPDMYNEYFKNNKLVICTNYENLPYRTKNILNVPPPYQLHSGSNDKNGIIIIDNDNIKLIKNDYSPKFRHVKINTIDDINSFDYPINDFIDVSVNEKIIEKKENLNKLNLLINKYNFRNVTYFKDKSIKDNPSNITISNFDIKKIIDDYIKDNKIEVEKELKTIYNIYSSK